MPTFFAASLALAGSKPLVFVPDASAAAGQLDGTVWTINSEHYTARLVLLDDATREKWLLQHAGAITDPFVSLPGAPPNFLTFLLDLECRGEGRIYFQPIGTRLIPPDGDLRNPLDVPSIQSIFEMLEKKLPPAYEGILNKVLLQKQVDLAPKARATGLIAFRVAGMSMRRFRLEVRLTGPSGEDLGFDAPYIAVKPGHSASKP